MIPEPEDRREEATERALRYLSHRPRSRFELERHLRRKGYDGAAIEAALARCASLGHLDDRAFAAAFARDRIRLRPRSVALMEAELRERGVSAADARAGIQEALRDEDTTEEALARRAAERAWRRIGSRDPDERRRKLRGYLARRGFPADLARRVTREIAGEDD